MQLKCKVCDQTFQISKPQRAKKTKYYCPHCGLALYLWKQDDAVTSYKCGNRECSHRKEAYRKLNASEKFLFKMTPNLFKINYQYREYHLTPNQYQHSAPLPSENTTVDIQRIHKSDNILGLVLAFYISFALSARQTSFVLRHVFNVNMSYQTVLNYTQSAAHYAHQFNLKYKGPIDDISVGDETYIKVDGRTHYVWFALSSKKHSVSAYHISDSRDTIPAIATVNEAIRTAKPGQELTYISDGLGSYVEAIQFLNKNQKQNKITHVQVIGLENKDEVSELYRPFKQLIERFNRTYKHHCKASAGFNCPNGAMALTTLFVTYFNFMRPHTALNYRTPIHIEQLEGIRTIQAKWVALLSMMLKQSF
jgi:transposase-like protein